MYLNLHSNLHQQAPAKKRLTDTFAIVIVSSDQINIFSNIQENSIEEQQRSYDISCILAKTYVTLSTTFLIH